MAYIVFPLMIFVAASAALQVPLFIQVLIGLGILSFGIGYIVSQLRRGSVTASVESINLANGEIELLKTANERLTQEMEGLKKDRQEENEKYQRELGRLNGVVEQLQRERDEFRRLVMLEKVPDALKKELTDIVSLIVGDVADHFDKKVDEIIKEVQNNGK